jgi:hypothetical protein
VQGAVRAAAIVHLRDGLLARIAAFGEAYCPIQYAGFGGEVLRGDVRAETGEAGFYAGGFVGFGTYRLRPGPLQVLPCGPQGFFQPQEVEAGHGSRDASGEHFRIAHFGLG